MTCGPCALARQLMLNLAIALDRAGNALLLGDPGETLSQRTARARLAGHRWAAVVCRALSIAGRLFGAAGDHCTNSLTPGTSGRELWPWSPPRR